MMRSSSVSPGSYHAHEHEITKCLHERKAAALKSGGAMAAGEKSAVPFLAEERKGFSVRGMLADGLRSVLARAAGFWGKAEPGEDGKDVVQENHNHTVQTLAARKERNHEMTALSVERAAGVMATALVKPETRVEKLPEEVERKVEKAQGSVSGGLKRESGGVWGFLKKFGESAAKAKQFLKKRKHTEISHIENNADLHIGNHSFLLDSYNRMGEYSTLAQDRSLEGNFRAKG